MGLLDKMMGNASEVDVATANEEFTNLLREGERIEKSYILVRDMLLFTNHRLVFVDKQGLTGKKVEYRSVPYDRIAQFSVETAGSLDMDAELKIWVSGVAMPMQMTFSKKLDIFAVQRVLASYVG